MHNPNVKESHEKKIFNLSNHELADFRFIKNKLDKQKLQETSW